MKFKVGDIVISNGKYNYYFTNETAILEVTKTFGGHNTIEVSVVKLLEGNPYYGEEGKMPVVTVNPYNFKHYGVPDNKLSRIVYPDYIEKDGRLVPKNIEEEK